jgi:hypothetical protein
MNILIIGDSWGVPNYVDPTAAKPEEHTEFRLRNLGYTVFNHAINGASNQKSMDSVDFSSLPPIDWIVWFHTECFRYNFDKNKTIYENLILESHETYKHAKTFFSKTNSKLAVVGGQAPIGPTVAEIFYEYINPNFIIEDWRSEILNEKMPECYTVSSNNEIVWVMGGVDNEEEKHILMETQIKILNAMRQSDFFPDHCHPGAEAHAELTLWLHQIFQNS